MNFLESLLTFFFIGWKNWKRTIGPELAVSGVRSGPTLADREQTWSSLTVVYYVILPVMARKCMLDSSVCEPLTDPVNDVVPHGDVQDSSQE